MSISFKMKLGPITQGKRDVHDRKTKENRKIRYKIQKKYLQELKPLTNQRHILS